MIGHLITNVAGSSDYFLGGVIAYAYEAKVKLLGVAWETLNTSGAVSRETVLEMAAGARLRLEADIAISASGIAYPCGSCVNLTVVLGLTAQCATEAYCPNRSD